MVIKISAFIMAYKHKKTDDEKKDYLMQHIKREYIPYEYKADIARAIVDASYYKNQKSVDGKEQRVFYIDSVAKHMLTCMAIVKLFTTIECSSKDGKMLEEFNSLNSLGIFDLIIQCVNQRELKEFNMVLQLTCDDIMANEYENHAYISKQIDRFAWIISGIIEPTLKDLDIENIRKVINNIK